MTWQAILESPIIERLGWVLFHFVWQGAVLALVLALALRVARRASASVRYLILLAGLVALAVSPVLTIAVIEPAPRGHQPPIPPAVTELASRIAAAFQDEPAASVPASSATLPAPSSLSADTGSIAGGAPASSPPWRDAAADRIRASLPWLVLFWVLGVLIVGVRQATAWAITQRLRQRWVRPVEQSVRDTTRRLAERMGIGRAVTVLESAAVEVPSLVGWLRPVILLPISALTGLTPGQIEAILAHELAHVRRHDYFVNLLQSVVETLLFYHPAVWWVGRRLRAEREHCCDELVVFLLGDARNYAVALTRMEELRTESSQYALALTGGSLMERIRRILGIRERVAKEGSERWLAGAISALVVLVATIWLGVAPPPEAMAQDAAPAIDADIKAQPGYVEFNPALVGNSQATAEITLPRVLLNMALSAARETDPALAELVQGLDVQLFQLRVFEDIDESVSASVDRQVRADADRLVESGWFPIVRVPEENVNILMRSQGDMIQGFVLMVSDGDELVFANLVGNIDSNELGAKAGQVLNKVMAGQIDIEALMEGLGASMGGGGGWEDSGPKLESTGVKAVLEVEEMELSGFSPAEDPSLGSNVAVRLDASDSRAVGSVRLEPGIWKAHVMILKPDDEHDAFHVSVNGMPAKRFFRYNNGYGRAEQEVQFELDQATDVSVVITAADETGVLLDRVEFEQFREPQPEASATLAPGEAIDFQGANIRAASIGGHRSANTGDDTVTLVINENGKSAETTVRALDTQFVNDLEITVAAVNPSPGQPGEGTATILIRRATLAAQATAAAESDVRLALARGEEHSFSGVDLRLVRVEMNDRDNPDDDMIEVTIMADGRQTNATVRELDTQDFRRFLMTAEHITPDLDNPGNGTATLLFTRPGSAIPIEG